MIQSRKRYIIIGMLLLSTTCLFAQIPDTVWTQTYPFANWGAECVRHTTDGGYIFVAKGFGYNNDMYVIKTDSIGDSLWAHVYGENDRMDNAHCIRQTPDGGYIVAGALEQTGPSAHYAYLLRMDQDGDTLWTKTYDLTGADAAMSVALVGDSGYVVTGWSGYFPNKELLLMRTDLSGDTLWVKWYGGPGFDEGRDLLVTPDGGYVIAGYTTLGGPQYQVWLLKTDSQGDTLWTRQYGGPNTDVAYSLDQTADGGYIMAGYADSYTGGEEDAYIVRTDSLGDTLWTRQFGTDSFDYVFSIIESMYGGFISVGWTNYFAPSAGEVWIIRQGVDGDTLWTMHLGEDPVNLGYYIQQTPDGACIISAEYAGHVALIKIAGSPITPFDLVAPNDSALQMTAQPMLIWEQSFEPDGIAYYNVYIDDTLRVQTTDTFWVPDYDLEEGYHQWYVVAEDTFGNFLQSEQTWSVGIDVNAPLIDSTTVWTDTSYAGPFEIMTYVTDMPAGVDSVLLYHKLDYYPTWIIKEMHYAGAGWYVDTIPAVTNSDEVIQYYIRALDMLQQESTDPDGAPAYYYEFYANYTGIAEDGNLPQVFSFGLNTNPSLGTVVFNLAIPHDADITLRVYDAIGRLVDTPIAGRQTAGLYSIPWDIDASAGIYFYSLESPWEKKTGKLILIK